jgi:hypothetical protein
MVGWTIGVVLLDLVLTFYVASHGFQPTNNEIIFGGFRLQLQWLPLLGVLVLALAVWSDVFDRIFPRWLGPEADPMARLRLLRVLTISLTAFVCFLYIPYLLGSNWFWIHLSRASRLIGSLQGFGSWLETVESAVLALDPVWQYALTQVIACAALVLSAWASARPTRRIRRVR